jgi:hypothetical protein
MPAGPDSMGTLCRRGVVDETEIASRRLEFFVSRLGLDQEIRTAGEQLNNGTAALSRGTQRQCNRQVDNGDGR